MCGGNFTNSSGLITSPSHPNSYPHNADCIYLISQPNGRYVNIFVEKADINCHADGPDYLEMRDGQNEDSPLMIRFCGDDKIPALIQSTQNYLRIR